VRKTAACDVLDRETVHETPETPHDSPLTMQDVLASPFYGDLTTAKLSPGDPAFAFDLPAPDGRRVRLADFRGVRPVALLFGSYT
jgi:hypothetical protein